MKENTNVLIVDKHESLRRLISTASRKIGMKNIVEVRGGKAALAELEANTIDLILCGRELSDMSGLDLLKAVRDAQKRDNTPFIMITNEIKREKIREAIEAGINNIILTPFTLEVFSKKITKAINN